MRFYSFYYLKWRHLVNCLPLDNAALKLQNHGVGRGVSRTNKTSVEFVACYDAVVNIRQMAPLYEIKLLNLV